MKLFKNIYWKIFMTVDEMIESLSDTLYHIHIRMSETIDKQNFNID